MEFTSSLAFLGKRLINHLIRTVESPVQDLCSALCYMEVLVCKVSSTWGFFACKFFDGKLFHWYVVWLIAQCFFAIGLYGWRVAWLVVWLIWSHVTFQFSFQSIITTYHFNWHISAFRPRFHTRTLVDRLHANIMALVRQDLQTKVTDAFAHLNTTAPTARKKTVGKNTFFIWWNTFIKNSTWPLMLSFDESNCKSYSAQLHYFVQSQVIIYVLVLLPTVRWIQMMPSTVCFEARDDSYGFSRTSKAGNIITFKLTYKSGYVTCHS